MNIRDKAELLIKKLLANTQDEQIKWTRTTETNFLTYATDDVVLAAYQTEYKNRNFVIYEAKYKTCDENERVYWTDRLRLDMVDSEGVLLWRLPGSRIQYDLLEAITIKASAIEETLDDLLED